MKWLENNFDYISGIIGVLAGATIISNPEKVSDFIIILIGIYWLFEGIRIIFEKYDNDK
jgi:uncharacterized membrane protein HdeD (DUF308 family)